MVDAKTLVPIFEIKIEDKPIVTMWADGRMEFGPTYDPNEAARLFWDAIQRSLPSPLLSISALIMTRANEAVEADQTRQSGSLEMQTWNPPVEVTTTFTGGGITTGTTAQICAICGLGPQTGYAGVPPCLQSFAGDPAAHRASQNSLKARGCLYLKD